MLDEKAGCPDGDFCGLDASAGRSWAAPCYTVKSFRSAAQGPQTRASETGNTGSWCARERRRYPLPKLKTHRGAMKRFKKTGTGKIKRGHASARHILTSKTRKQKRKLRKSGLVSDGDHKRIARMLL